MHNKKPNILLILTDDQGAWAMNCAGTKELYTPNLNRIADSGMRFANFFCVSPVCSPARASLFTGNIPSAHGVHDWIRSGNVDAVKFARQGADNPYADGYQQECTPIAYLEGQTTYTDLLMEDGYTCALSGKWHLGDSINPQHGFKKWYTLGVGGCNYYHPDIVENGNIKVEHGKYVTELFTNKALEYLDELAEADHPFYLAVHYTAPHSPWGSEHHPQKWLDYYESCEFSSIPNVLDHPDLMTGPVYGTPKRKENLQGYFASISAMDEQVGRILDALEEKQLQENTIVIFTSDNGMSMGHHGVWGKGNGTFPMNMYDTAVKVPFLISYPPIVKSKCTSEEMVSAYDLFPTLMELTNHGKEIPSDLPGKSFLGVLEGKCKEEDSEIVVFDEYGPVRMIRNREWKYIHRYPYGGHELYHLLDDPNETRNLYGSAAYESKTLELKQQLERWFLKYADPAMDGTKEGVTGAGQLCRSGIYGDRKGAYATLE